MIYMPAGRLVWRDVAKAFEKKGFPPKIWLGDPVHDEFAKKSFPECVVVDFFEINKRVNESSLGDVSSGSMSSVLNSSYFHYLKDQVYKMMDRQDDLGCYGRLEREALFYSMFFYFFKLVKEKDISVLVSSEGPHSPSSMVLYGIAKILGIPRYHLVQNSVIPVAHIAKDFFGERLSLTNTCVKEKHFSLVRDYADKISDSIPEPLYMTLQKEYDRKNNRALFKTKEQIKSLLRLFRKDKFTSKYGIYKNDFFISNERPASFGKGVGKRVQNLSLAYESVIDGFDFSVPFVFVPLHYEPERTTNPDGGLFYNSYDMLMCLRELVPAEVPIVIKEHYSQLSGKLYGYRGRSPLFYSSVKNLGNIHFVDLDTPSSRLIKDCLFVATQTGSAALEAALMRKKSLVFGSPWFLGVSNVYSYSRDKKFDEIIGCDTFEKDLVVSDLMEYISSSCIPIMVNPSGETYFRKLYSDLFGELVDDDLFVSAFTENILYDYVRIV